MNELSKDAVTWSEVAADAAGQRVDNFLVRILKGVPKSHVYRILRTGEVRVNGSRVSADYRVQAGDRLRIPPVRVAARQPTAASQPTGRTRALERAILYEDDCLIAFDKPAGLAVHGGSGVSTGVIEQFRQARPAQRFLELVHRLDRDTSGILLLAKRRPALVELHRMLREGDVRKRYVAVVAGAWIKATVRCDAPLRRHVLASGERRVSVHREGQQAGTVFRRRASGRHFSLVEAELETGRTHQIRVHLAHLGFPIAGDDKYGRYELNDRLAATGIRRMLLHAGSLVFRHPVTGTRLALESPLPKEFAAALESLLPAAPATG
jgi:23S rRNA pseudouridine955/2504/2580 synthase